MVIKRKDCLNKKITHVIRGDEWTIEVMSSAAYKKKWKDDSAATCDGAGCTIDFAGDFDVGLLIHELLHAEFFYFCLESTTKLDADDMEEIAVSFFQKNYFKFGKMISAILEKLVGRDKAVVMLDKEMR